MWTLLLLLSIPAYLYAGMHIGDKAIKSWDDEDNESLAAKMLFPFNAHRGSVGDCGMSLIDLLRYEFGDDGAYRVMMAAFWPIKMF